MPRASAKKLFNPQMIDRLKPEKGKRIEMMDSNCPGLVVRVTENGTRSFSVLYRVAGKTGRTGTGRTRYGKQQRLTLGRWPDVGLKEALDRARAIIAGATEGRDPKRAMEEEERVRDETRLDEVISRFIAQECKANVKSWKNIERILRLYVLPRWGEWPLAEIRRKHVHALLDDLVESDKRGTAREVRKHLSRLFNWAVDRELVDMNPIYLLQRKDLMPNPEAGRALTDNELKAVWHGAGELGYPFGQYYRLLLLTGQRRAEWSGAKRSDIDLDTGTWKSPAVATRVAGITWYRSRHLYGRSLKACRHGTVTTIAYSAPRVPWSLSLVSHRASAGSMRRPVKRCGTSPGTDTAFCPVTASTISA